MFEELKYNEETLNKVRRILEKEVSPQTATDIISEMQNEGILFRERVKDGNKGTVLGN